MNRFASFTIRSGIVAENSSVRCSPVTCDRISSTSSIKPMFSISSASSSTAHFAWSSGRRPRFITSSTRPGVPTTICAPRESRRSCSDIDCPPYTVNTCNAPSPRREVNSSATCNASSRVGASTSACGIASDTSIDSNIGNPKAAVFPVPVCAWPITSHVSPSSTGIAIRCIGVGDSNPFFPIAANDASDKPNPSNVFTSSLIYLFPFFLWIASLSA